MKKILFFLIILIIFGSLLSKEVKAGGGDNVWGWAWSENIGWVKFNNCTDPADPGTCEPIDYGVDIDEITGVFSGYAWSEYIGWISFNSAELVGCPIGACDAKVDLDGMTCGKYGYVCGWARACAVFADPDACSGALDPNRGDWDGWIRLRGVIPGIDEYGVSIDTVVGPPYEFQGWAWGGDDTPGEAVIGWVSFNCENCEGGVCDSYPACGDPAHPDYKVMTSFPFNQSPYAEPGSVEVEGEGYCFIGPAAGLVSLKWLYQDGDGDRQSDYWLQVSPDPLPPSNVDNCPDCVVDCIVSQNVGPGEEGTAGVKVVPSPSTDCAAVKLEIGYHGPGDFYFWRIKVKDEEGLWSLQWEEGDPFETPLHAWPAPDFTWSPDKPSVGEVVQFCSTKFGDCLDEESTCYNFANEPVTCLGGTFSWTFPWIEGVGGDYVFTDGTTADFPNPRIKLLKFVEGDITLEVRDQDGLGPCAVTHYFGPEPALPEWKEIPPILWLKKIFADVTDFFDGFLKF